MIYLICSESNELIKEEINKIINNSKNVLKMDLNNSTIDDLLMEASYYSLFNEEKFIIIKNSNIFSSEKTNEDDIKKLLKYFESPNQLTNLIFTTNNSLDSRKKITKVIKEKYKLISINNLKFKEIYDKLIKFFTTNDYKIDDNSLNYIITNNHNNYDLIINEAIKIMTYYNKPCKVQYDDVCKIVARSLETNNFRFVDAIINKNLSEAFNIYNDLMLMKVEPLSLIGLLAREYRLLLLTKTLKSNNYTFVDTMQLLKLQEWQLDKYLRNINLFSLDELKDIMIKLSNLDLDIKRGYIDKYVGLKNLMLDIMT